LFEGNVSKRIKSAKKKATTTIKYNKQTLLATVQLKIEHAGN